MAGFKAALLGGALVGLTVATTPLLLPQAGAIELRGQTFFASPPWHIRLRNFFSYVNDSGGEYYITLRMPEAAGVGLGGLQIIQTRGVDRNFGFDDQRTRAFLGEPRREGAPVAVSGSFDPLRRQFTLEFPVPVPPGSTVTVALRPFRNPSQSDTYMFQVTAFPAGPNPVSSPVGSVTLPIYEGFDF